MPRCAFMVDIQKAYDTVDWCFLKEVLLAFGFHVRMVDGIMKCVTTTSYSFCINGVLHYYFKGKRSLAGHCSKLELVNLCFTDDLFLFAHGDPNSARVIMEALDEFRNASGLTPSLLKSMAYFCNVLNHVKLYILQIIPFEEGQLPVKYLGVPLISTRLIYKDCKELTDRIRSRIRDCKNKSLSAAGRLQLVRSVIGSMHGDMQNDVDDRLEWRDRVGVVKPFSVVAVWDSLKELAGLSNVADSITVIKCLSDEPLAIPLDEIHIDDELNFIEEPVEIMDREVKRLKQSRIPIVKVRWNSRRGPKYTWEREDQMQKKYPHLFANPESASQATS
ncbi:hypothetical protein Tco_1390644 [Tanacetum coccineum]